MVLQFLRKYLTPLEQVTDVVKRVAEGDLTSNAQSAENAGRFSQNAGQVLVRGSKGMEELEDSFAEMSQSAHQMRTVIKTINDIAFRTNILALNGDICDISALVEDGAVDAKMIGAKNMKLLVYKLKGEQTEPAVLFEGTLYTIQDGKVTESGK